ncbi:3'-5' exonuclease [Barrientosiimonas marina]
MRFTAIDFETANASRSSPCAVGLAVVDDGVIVDEFYSLINPLMTFSSFNIGVHGITAGDVSDAPTFAQLWPTLESYLTQQMVVAHNASFDMGVLRHTLDAFNLAYPVMNYLCTCNISRIVWPELSNHKLNTVARKQGIQFNHHHALEDARVAAKILTAAFRTYDTAEMDIFLEKCHLSKGRINQQGYVPPRKKSKRKSRSIYL